MGNIIIIDLNSAANLKSLPSMFLPLPFVDRFLFRTFFAPAFFPPPPLQLLLYFASLSVSTVPSYFIPSPIPCHSSTTHNNVGRDDGVGR